MMTSCSVALTCVFAVGAVLSVVDAVPRNVASEKELVSRSELGSTERAACVTFGQLRDSVNAGNGACASSGVSTATKACIMNGANSLKAQWRAKRDAGSDCFDKAAEMRSLGRVIGSCLQLETFVETGSGGYSYRQMMRHFEVGRAEVPQLETSEKNVPASKITSTKEITGKAVEVSKVEKFELESSIRTGCSTSGGMCKYWCCYYSVVYGSDYNYCLYERQC